MTDREAYVTLNLISGIGPVRIAALADACGSVSEIFERTESELCELPGVGRALASKIVSYQNDVDPEKEFRSANAGGVEIVTLADDNYPEPLRELRDAPVCLYIRGTLNDDMLKRSLSLVGTRNITPYGASMARHLAESAAYATWTTVSGMAVGVDTVVHTATLDAGGVTVGVLGGGLARFHPQENLALARRTVENGGAIISEFPMSFAPTRHTFPMRNRIISALTLGTIVVEAGTSSGSIITATLAIEQGKRVFAVPGQVDMPSARGCHELIRKGAVLVENFDHVLEEFDFLPGFDNGALSFREDAGEYSTDGGTASFSPAAKMVIDVLPPGGKGMFVEDISLASGVSPAEIMGVLISLEIMNAVKRQPDGSYSRIR